jgi:hypothetical protein
MLKSSKGFRWRTGVGALTALVLVGALQGCASTRIEREVDRRIQSSSVVVESSAREDMVKKEIMTAPDLTQVQRDKLLALQAKTHARSKVIIDESRKLRMLLLEDMLSSNYNADEVAVIEDRLQKLSKKRLNLVFDAVDEARWILGKPNPRSQKLLDGLMEAHGFRD